MGLCGTEAEAGTGACFVRRIEPVEVLLHPAPSSGSPGNPEPGWCPGRCCGRYHSHDGEEEGEGAAAVGPWGTAAWGPGQSSVWEGGLSTSLEQKCTVEA